MADNLDPRSTKQRNRTGYARRQARKQQQDPGNKQQVVGSADDPLGPAFAMLLERMEQQTREIRLMNQNIEAMKAHTDEKLAKLQGQIAREKAAAIEGMRAAEQGLKTLAEKEPVDENIKQAWLTDAIKQAQKQAAHKKQKFLQMLPDFPKGEIVSTEPGALPLTINGVTIVIQPGLNRNVPQPFIQLWEERIEMIRFANEREAAIRGARPFGDLETWRNEGKMDEFVNFYALE